MARLPSKRWLVQDDAMGEVSVFREGDELEIARFDPTNVDATARAQKHIHDSEYMSDEDKCFAHFWCGYFHALYCPERENSEPTE